MLAIGGAMIAAVALSAPASAKTKTVYPGGPAKWAAKLARKGDAVNRFLVQRVTINVGDTVDWNGKSLAGNFHDVDLPVQGGGDVPFIINTAQAVSGANDAAGNPFWFNGKPGYSFNPALAFPTGGTTYDGTTRLTSGLPLGKPTDFKVTFTKAGTYKYFCDIHPDMVGFVVVRPAGKKVPSAAQDRKMLAEEEASSTSTLKSLSETKVTGKRVQLGAASTVGPEVLAFFPSKLTVKRGTTVTFAMGAHTREFHTATFGDVSKHGYLAQLANAFVGPLGAIDPIGAYPSDPTQPLVLSPTSHGNGFVNTGALDTDSDTKTIPASGRITFTKAGTYRFICLIHPFMHGTIVVK
jgi:plastocyanin